MVVHDFLKISRMHACGKLWIPGPQVLTFSGGAGPGYEAIVFFTLIPIGISLMHALQVCINSHHGN